MCGKARVARLGDGGVEDIEDAGVLVLVREAFEAKGGKLAKSWPAGLPLFRLDRIYVRGLDIVQCEMHPWRKISDHAALSAVLAVP